MLTSRRALIVAVLVLLVTSLLPVGKARLVSSVPTWLAETLSVPVSWPVNMASHALRPEPVGRVEQVTEAEFAERLAEYDRLNRELWAINKDLQESLEAFEAITLNRDPRDIKPVEAAVVSFNNDRNNPVMLINQGSRAGVKKNDPVVFKTNLLGFVKEAGTLNSKVELISRPGFSIRVALQPPGPPTEGWPLLERAHTDGSGQQQYVDLQLGHNLRPDDIVWVYDDMHEQAHGLLLGRVVAITDHPDRPLEFDRIVIRPDVPIGPQGRVIVMTEREEEE